MPSSDGENGKRAQTDQSLQAERAKTDAELARRRTKVEEGADATVRAAREHSDSMLTAARQREDQSPAMRAAGDLLSGARVREDAAIAQERVRGDAALDAERLEGRVALASLLAAERKETNSRLLLERADADALLERRDELLALVSHDLRSLLGAVAMGTAMIDKEIQRDAAQVPRYCGAIKRATAQMNRLVSDLLEVASFDAGKLVLQFGSYDAAELVHHVAETFESMSMTKELVISTRTPKRPLPAIFDADRIGQILANLIGNAIKFTAAGGHIVVSVEPEGANLRFSVADSGQGIAPEKLGGIFERYAQARRSEGGGLGLGLYIARRLVESHGGRIWAESVVGQGSTFFFLLPAER